MRSEFEGAIYDSPDNFDAIRDRIAPHSIMPITTRAVVLYYYSIFRCVLISPTPSLLFQSATSPASCSHASLECLHDYRSALAVLSSPLSRRRRRRCGRHYPAWTKKQEERKEHLRLAHLTVQDEVAAHELSIQEAKKKQSEKVRISFVEPLSPFFGLVWFAHRSFSSLRPLLPQAAAAALKASRAKARAKKAGAGGKRARGGGGGKRGGGSK